MNYKIALIRGDGIGPEIVHEAVGVLDKVGEKLLDDGLQIVAIRLQVEYIQSVQVIVGMLSPYHSGNEIQRSHSNADVLVVDAREDGILVFSDEMRVCRYDLDHRKECNVFHCTTISLRYSITSMAEHTVLVRILNERV